MKNETIYLTGPLTFERKETPMPVCGPEQVLVRVCHMGICGSDVMFYHDPTVGGALPDCTPFVLGHECAGEIVQAGEAVTDLRVGDRVALEPGVPCLHCEQCLTGHYNLCPDVNFMAAPPFLSGALNRYIAHPANFCFKLPDTMDTVAGAMVEPFAVGAHAAERAGAAPGMQVIILGAGCIGLMTLLACKARGVADVTVVDLFDNRLDMARKLGATHTVNAAQADTVTEGKRITGGKGYTIVFETAGSAPTARITPQLVKAGGRICLVGNIHGEVPFDFFAINCKEADILSVFRYRNNYRQCVEMIAGGAAPVKQIATDFFTFDQIDKAFDCALNRKQTALKVIVEF